MLVTATGVLLDDQAAQVSEELEEVFGSHSDQVSEELVEEVFGSHSAQVLLAEAVVDSLGSHSPQVLLEVAATEEEDLGSQEPQVLEVVGSGVLVVQVSHSTGAVASAGQLVTVGPHEVMVTSSVWVTVDTPAEATATRPAAMIVERILITVYTRV